MRGITAIALLTFLVKAHANGPAAQSDLEALANRVTDRILEAAPVGQDGLDSTALGKAAQLVASPRASSLVPHAGARTSPAVRARPVNSVGDYVSPGASPWAVAPALVPTSSDLFLGSQAPLKESASAREAVRSMAVARSSSLGSKMLEGKVALVTGASRGIGAAIAEELAQAGATVVGTATSDSGAESISGRFTGDLKGTGMKLDVGNQEDVDRIIKAMNDEYGGVDILINNAGITKDGLMMMMKQNAWDDVISTNLGSVFKMTKGVLRGMTKKKWGRIISISSVVGSMGNGGQTNYAAAKAGMDGFTRALAREVASRGVTVNSVAPGFIKSDMTDQLKDEWKDELLKSVPLGRLGTPKEIADSVLYLASPMADYVTGQTLHVNGGMYM